MANASNPENEGKSNGGHIVTDTKQNVAEGKTNGSQIVTDTKQNVGLNDSSIITGSVETVYAKNGTSTARRLLEDNKKQSQEGGSESKEKGADDVHAATVENEEGLEANVDSSFDLLRDNDELADEYGYDYDDYVDETLWGDEEFHEGLHEKLEDYVNVDSHILCTPVSYNFNTSLSLSLSSTYLCCAWVFKHFWWTNDRCDVHDKFLFRISSGHS